MRRHPLIGLLLAASAFGAADQAAYESPPVCYSKTPPADRISVLQAKIATGRTLLRFEESHGYLKSFLAALDIPASSQALVFSKTSFQQRRINPRAPRAIYFNDDLYVGWVQGGEVVEIASVDPQLGAVFYTLAQEAVALPRFVRQTDNCLQCHDSSSLTLGVPGLTVRSVYPGGDGLPHFERGGFRTTYRSPISERWGGWYVTGEHGGMRHLGNAVYPDDPNADTSRLAERGANLTDLSRRIDVSPYLTESSDIVALMVLEHQTLVHNLITRANHETRSAIAQSDEINRMSGAPARPLTEGAHRRIKYACEPLLEALLFSGEAPLTDRVKGTSTFAADFEKRGPIDAQGRSLRSFDLGRRMFRYPLSYMIYSQAFAGLPKEARGYLADRMKEILLGRDPTPPYSHLSATDRRAILEILAETLPDLASGWK